MFTPNWASLVAAIPVYATAPALILGPLSFTFVKLRTGRRREISPHIWAPSVLSLLR
jgi:hypothetical protein